MVFGDPVQNALVFKLLCIVAELIMVVTMRAVNCIGLSSTVVVAVPMKDLEVIAAYPKDPIYGGYYDDLFLCVWSGRFVFPQVVIS
jgi:hypothetical protein